MRSIPSYGNNNNGVRPRLNSACPKTTYHRCAALCLLGPEQNERETALLDEIMSHFF